LFVVENNHYASHLHIDFRQKDQAIARFGESFGIETKTVDGNNALDVYEAAIHAVRHIREGKGPFLLECFVNRWRGHVGPRWDPNVGLRSQDQIDEWVSNCPIQCYQQKLVDANLLSLDEGKQIEADLTEDIEKFAEHSLKQKKPPTEEVGLYVYTEEGSD
ncbi:MAG: thiamine pyrophosphate-dependent enzyme, partial [Candidatus Thorarchaeota archaeon]